MKELIMGIAILLAFSFIADIERSSVDELRQFMDENYPIERGDTIEVQRRKQLIQNADLIIKGEIMDVRYGERGLWTYLTLNVEKIFK